jgi:hypothetical protein
MKGTPENDAERAYAITGNQSAPISIAGGKITLPRERRARMKSARVIMTPAASKKVFVVENETATDGIYVNIAATSVVRSAQMLTVSSERRFETTGDCGGMVDCIDATQ